MKKEAIQFISEEDLNCKIILPFIQSLGISLDELEFEKSFRIRLGRNSIVIKSKKEKDYISGRLDILCKRDTKNLFVIEVKADNIDISQEDIEQGLSYARQLDFIAPFVLITNGKLTRVFDSITLEELNGTNIGDQSAFWKNGCKLATEEELYLRYETLKNFIGYSTENIKLFSGLQIEDRMSTLKGSKTDLIKKYIPELFVERENLYNIVDQFINSNYTTFAIIGESGVGKTNYICNLAERLAPEYISLFFNASSMNKSILEEIKDDFNWSFSAQLEASELFKRLESLAIKAKTKVLIFIDAIDESPFSNIEYDLNDFCRKLKHFYNIKMFVSCKVVFTHIDRPDLNQIN